MIRNKTFLDSLLCSVAAGALLIAFDGPVAADETVPAVARPNGKVDVSAGSVGRNPAAMVGGSFSLPVGHTFGLQLDTGFSKSSEDKAGGLAAHFFTRDPNAYLAGLTSMWVRVNGRNVWRNGLEAELYLGDVTLSASGGLQNGYGLSTGYASADAGYYVTEDFLVGLGVSGFSSYRAIVANAEYRPLADSPLSVFANAGAGNRDGGFGVVGVRLSFGADGASLKRQHRELDPPNILTHFTSRGDGIGVSQQIEAAEAAEAAANVVAPAPPPPPPICFVAGTLVRMADGSAKRIEDIAVGDRVLGMDGTTNEVTALKPAILGDRKLYALNGDDAFVTDSHPLMTTSGWKAIDPTESARVLPELDIGRLETGDMLVGLNGNVAVRSLQVVTAHPGTEVYNFSVTNNRTYYAARATEPDTFLLAHNR